MSRIATTASDYYWDEASQQYLPSVRLDTMFATVTSSTMGSLCPDLLRLSDLGVADNWRGKMVRGFFRVLGWVTGV